MITLRNVEKFYEGGYGRTYVLRRINVTIKDGEFVTIMGPSGAGKSTLLSILGMLDGAWTGEFEFLNYQFVLDFEIQKQGPTHFCRSIL